MFEFVSLLYLLFIFWISAWQGFEFSYRPGKNHKEIIGCQLKISKNGVAKPDISHLYILVLGSLYMLSTFIYGSVAYIIQIVVYAVVEWLLNINMKFWPDTIEYFIVVLYGLIALFGFHFGKACFFSFANKELTKLVNERDSKSNSLDGMNVDKAINENLQRKTQFINRG